LSEKISVPVTGLSADGITTTDALKLIRDLKSAQPQAVIIELGGHDFLLGHSRSDTANNLIEIIHAGQSVGASVVLMEIPRGFITDAFHGLHPNQRGNEYLAKHVVAALTRMYGERIVRKDRAEDSHAHVSE
jgi:lysophospholipase L1-like esterase